MRQKPALLTAAALMALAGPAAAETWKGYSAVTPNNIQWSYDTDYVYRDQTSGKIVVLAAAGKVGADPRVGPSAPGAADGAGQVIALDCKKKTMTFLSSYSPKKPLGIADDWRRSAVTKSIKGDADTEALAAMVCPTADAYPVK